MPVEGLVLLIVILLVSAYSAYVLVLVARADFYSRGQKTAQALLALLIPILGALIVHWMYRLHQMPEKKPDRAFIPQHDDPAGGMPPDHHAH